VTAPSGPKPATIWQALAWRRDVALFKVHLALAKYHMRAGERLKARCPLLGWAEGKGREKPTG
jgi:hypothetical protein